jgi:hypothetical protein
MPSQSQTDSRIGKPQSATTNSDTKQANPSKTADGRDQKPPGSEQKLGKPGMPAKASGEADDTSLQEKESMARMIISGVVATADRIDPVEYSILVQVEAATLLWDLDKDQAGFVLKTAFDRLRALLNKKADPKAPDHATRQQEMSRLRASIFRRIARLKPDLIRELTATEPAEGEGQSAVAGQWTEEAQAIMVVAQEELERSPLLAADLVEQSLSFGVPGGLPDFLARLRRRDRELAEQQAMRLLTQLRERSVSPLLLVNFASFVLSDKNASAQLRDRFFESVVIRLRRDIRPDLPVSALQDLLFAARSVAQWASAYPRWQAELAQITSEVETLFAARSQLAPETPRPRVIDVSGLQPAAEGETQDIAKAASQVGANRDSKARDQEYRKLAISAAQKADVRLAEELLSKIGDEELRRKTTISVYGPLVRKALGETDWIQAKTYALKIADSLGRTLVVDWVARAMIGAHQDTPVVKELYNAALMQLQRDPLTPNVGKSFLILAKSLLAIDAEGGFLALNGAVSVLNKTAATTPFSAGSQPPRELATWIRTTTSLGLGDVLDLVEMIGPVFQEMGKRDANQAQSLALGLSHPGLKSLAQLGGAKGLLEEIRNSKKLVEGGK